MDRFSFGKLGWMKLARLKGRGPVAQRRRQAALKLESLEGRVVMSAGGGFLGGLERFGAQFGGFDGGGPDFGPHGGGGPQGGGNLVGTGSSVLGQDAMKVNQAYQTFNASIQADVATLRQTATSTAGPSTTGIAAFNTAVESAVTTLNASVTTDLANLPATGTAIASTIAGYTATLQAEVESAGSALSSSTSSSVMATDREIGMYLRTASSQSTQAIVTDAPTGSVTGTTAQTFNKAVQTAFQTFQTTINTAKQTAITNGTTLDSSTVSTAVATLQSSITTAADSLGTAFTASTTNPATAVTTALTSLTTQLTAVTAPTAGSNSSARTFAIAINSAISKAHITVNQLFATAISGYNSSLL